MNHNVEKFSADLVTLLDGTMQQAEKQGPVAYLPPTPTTQQSEALRLADALEEKEYPPRRAAAEELRRLHAENEDHIQQLRKEQLEVERMHRVNAQLLEALARLVGCIDHGSDDPSSTLDVARAAIAAAKEMK